MARLLTGLSARVVPTTSEDHDRVVAAVSHVPHLLAVALATAVADPLAATLAAGSFRDGTRVAASAPELTAAMCGGNAAHVLDALDAVLGELDQARDSLDSDDPIAHAAPVGGAGPCRPDDLAPRLGRRTVGPGHRGRPARPRRRRRLDHRRLARRPFGHLGPPGLTAPAPPDVRRGTLFDKKRQ